eukprot:tig00000849_g4763.t1
MNTTVFKKGHGRTPFQALYNREGTVRHNVLVPSLSPHTGGFNLNIDGDLESCGANVDMRTSEQKEKEFDDDAYVDLSDAGVAADQEAAEMEDEEAGLANEEFERAKSHHLGGHKNQELYDAQVSELRDRLLQYRDRQIAAANAANGIITPLSVGTLVALKIAKADRSILEDGRMPAVIIEVRQVATVPNYAVKTAAGIVVYGSMLQDRTPAAYHLFPPDDVVPLTGEWADGA